MNEQKKNDLVGITLCCPVCGSTALACEAVCTVMQDEYGNWSIDLGQEKELNFSEAITGDRNNNVRCTNPFCGKPYDPESHLPLELVDDESLEQFYDRTYGSIDADDHDEEYIKQRDVWIMGLYHEPWVGIIDDCLKLI